MALSEEVGRVGYGANLLEPKALFALVIIPVVRLPNRASTIGVNLDAPGNLMLPRHNGFHFMAGNLAFLPLMNFSARSRVRS